MNAAEFGRPGHVEIDSTGAAASRGEAPANLPSGGRVVAAPRFHRLTALLVDGLLALALVLLVRLLVRIGVFPAIGNWHPGEQSVWIDAQVFVASASLTALRDVPFGASFAKWLLCMRLTDRAGRPFGLLGRILRAPSSLLPFAWMSSRIQSRQSWRVSTYTPTRRGLALRTAFAAAAAVTSVAWGIETVRPSIGRNDALRLASATLLSDPRLQLELGPPLQMQVRTISPRAHEIVHGQLGKFELQIRGRERQQDMVVHARKVDGAWAIDTIVDIDISAIDSDVEPVATR